MNYQTSNAGRDITAHIGALELSAINAFDDGTLEASVNMGPPAPTMGLNCLTQLNCRPRIDDGALEATVQAGPSTMPPACRRTFIDDGDLEATLHAGPMTRPPQCRFIDDGTLETIVQAGPGPSGVTRFPVCMPRIDDGELEATVHAGPSTHLRRSTVCLNIDDRALEASIQAGPSPTMPGYPGCRFRIDDGALEAIVQAGPQRPTAIRLPGGGCLPGVDDSALEATVQAGPSTMPPACRFHIDDGALEQAAAHADMGPSVQRVAGRCY